MVEKVRAQFRFAYKMLAAAGRQYGVDRAGRMAAALAYRTFFALAPVLIVAVWVLGSVIGSDADAQEAIVDAIARFAGADVAQAIEPFLTSVVLSSGLAALIGVVLLLWTASSLFLEMQHDLNDIFGVAYERTTGVVASMRKRGIGFLWALGLGLVFLAVWLINVGWRFVEDLFPDNLVGVHTLITFLAPLVSLIVLPVIIALLFQTLTLTPVRWRAAWYGGIFTSIIFLAAAYGIGLYFSWDDQTSAVAIAGSVFVVLLMAYVLAGVFLFGAEVTRVYSDYLVEGDVQQPAVRETVVPTPPLVLVSDPPKMVPPAAIGAFLIGLLLGFRRSKK